MLRAVLRNIRINSADTSKNVGLYNMLYKYVREKCAFVKIYKIPLTMGFLHDILQIVLSIKGKTLVMVLMMNRKNLEELSDEELVKLSQEGDKEALETILSRYKNLVYSKSRPYFLAGADDDDIIQEGFIGLYKAVKDFDGDRFPFFKVFAGVCVTRHIITAVKAASRKKHLPLNSYVSLDKNTYDDESDIPLQSILVFNELQDPEAILIDRENTHGMEYKINKALSTLEMEVLVCYLDGMSYQEIADKLSKDAKAVDNAMQRIKKKLKGTLDSVVENG